MEDYWVWGASVVKGEEDGRYHMFASRWPKRYPFFNGYIFYSEVVRAVADTPEGPFEFQEVVLKTRGPEFWDGRVTHNPTIHKSGDTYLLFYIGTTYEGEGPAAESLQDPMSREMRKFKSETYSRIRIGLATAKSPAGPWTRRDEPALNPRPGKWDDNVTTNPAPSVATDGSILLVYRSNVSGKGTRLGVAKARAWDQPFERLRDDYLEFHVEDPYIWWVDDHYEMIAKDQSGDITGEFQAGIHATSRDGIDWIVSDPPKAYSRLITWDDGTRDNLGSFERPQLLIENGKPMCLYCATGDGPGGFRNATRTWNVATPLTMSLPLRAADEPSPEKMAGPPGDGWKLVFEESFDGADEDLDARWDFQNGPSGHILSSRWRDNVKLEDGILKMIARKEERAGQDWTAASLWTKREFQYGYFECRYRYAPVAGTNNSFWLMSKAPRTQPGRFEIDINEGHYPYEVNMNLHQHSGKHWAKGGRWYYYGSGPAHTRDDAGWNFVLGKPVTTSRLRLVSPDSDIVRIMEWRVFPPSEKGYPSVFPNPKEAQPDVGNLAAGATIEASSALEPRYGPERAIDGELSTASRWVSGRDDERRVLTLSFGEPREIGCIQLVSGWQNGDQWEGIVNEFRCEYWDGAGWKPVPGVKSTALPEPPRDPEAPADLGHSFHVYGLEWNEKELIYYFDGREIRRIENEICHGPSPIWLSLAIIRWAGPVTDAIDGKSMDVDWVRVWQQSPK